MSVTSSSSSNSSNFLLHYCVGSALSMNIGAAIAAVRTILTVPPCILVLYLGYQRWRQQRSFKTTSHSDIFTYHMAVMALIWVFGGFCSLYGTYANLQAMITAGYYLVFIVFFGEIFFHLLTCVERYLAVVHPVTYLGLRNERGVMIRNISIASVWLLCFGSIGALALYMPNYPEILFYCVLVASLIVVSFCSLSVLCILFRPGPGEGGGAKERVDQSKQRALLTIAAITGALWLWIGAFLVFPVLGAPSLLSPTVGCALMVSAGWFNLPCSLVLPLLYLHRAGKLSCCCNNKE